MGKVKSLEEFTMKRRIVYQFPMGKVKFSNENRSKRTLTHYVSIPYGKGKDKYLDFPLIVSEYQFPMGKVKLG